MRFDAGEVAQGRKEIDQLDRSIDHDSLGQTGAGEDQWVPQDRRVHRRGPFLDEPVVAEVLTVIGEEADQRVIGGADVVDRLSR